MKLATITILLIASILGTCSGCADNEFECVQTGSCIPKTRVCDGFADCVGGTDEANCPTTTTTTRASTRCPEFECNNGTCIPSRWICDNDPDCTEGEDELNCPSTTPTPCTGFACKDGLCIPSSWECDEYVDCVGGEDEANCGI